MQNEKIGLLLIGLAGVVALIYLGISDKMPQDLQYHNFSDTKSFLSIPNAINVLTNLPLLIIGVMGSTALLFKPLNSFNIVTSNVFAYLALFMGTALVGIGSSYYHLSPDNDSLAWDRLPIALAFMGLYSAIIGEFISQSKGRLLLVPLLLVGILSVLYWWYSESQGAGDLRYYAVVQFFPIVTIPIILLFFRSDYHHAPAYWFLLVSYLLAKLFEHFDSEVHEALIVVSGHSLKHVLPAIGLYVLFKSYTKKQPKR